MALDTAKVETRSISDLLTLQRVTQDTNLSAAERMEFAAAIVAGWERALDGAPSRSRVREFLARHPTYGLLFKLARGGYR